eukprot:UN04402
MPINSFRNDVLTILHSFMIVPNVIPSIGPINGETSILATTAVELSCNKPTADIQAATKVKAKIIKCRVQLRIYYGINFVKLRESSILYFRLLF